MIAGWKSVALGAIGMAVLLVVIALVVILTGAYNVAATQRHTPVGAWALNTNFTNSVQGRARGINAPEFTADMVAAGADHYKAMCVHCHGGIGEPRAEWATGMRPKPPALAQAAAEWNAAEIFWLIKHGAKMTGMPAFGPTHDDAELWNIAAFVKAMPKLSPEEYARLGGRYGDSGETGHTHR